MEEDAPEIIRQAGHEFVERTGHVAEELGGVGGHRIRVQFLQVDFAVAPDGTVGRGRTLIDPRHDDLVDQRICRRNGVDGDLRRDHAHFRLGAVVVVVRIGIGISIGVSIGVGVGIGTVVRVSIGIGVGVSVFVFVGVGVVVGVGIDVSVGVSIGVLVGIAVGIVVGVVVGVVVRVVVRVGVRVGVGVRIVVEVAEEQAGQAEEEVEGQRQKSEHGHETLAFAAHFRFVMSVLDAATNATNRSLLQLKLYQRVFLLHGLRYRVRESVLFNSKEKI